ncbi:MAG: YicC family protein [Candidatus Bipolaricaulota bacterium]|jgi:uncharacterized protein (TIGR00255 family)|nr:YicC family protein [Candidatus Bipolaricaulota bacterium]
MVYSMTGFGTGASRSGLRRADVTIRTLNHRYLSVRLRSLSDWPLLQTQVEEALRKAFSRGEIDVWVALGLGDDGASETLFERGRVARCVEELRRLCEEFRLPTPCLGDLIRVGALEAIPPPEEDLWSLLEPALSEAMKGALAARREEGSLIGRELARILDELESLVGSVKVRVPALREALRERLLGRIAALQIEADPARLETEVALLADRCDVEEEVTRLEGHLGRARGLLGREGPMGKELDFLSQELLREVNTLGAKSRDLEVSSLVLDMKIAVERFKEQAQNVE